MAWKNGLGFTNEIAIHPESSNFVSGDFLWRISSAKVAESSDFSLFPDYDRILLVLAGSGLKISYGENIVELASMQPLEFSGAVKTRGDLLDDQVTDLNVFTRKGKCRAKMEVHFTRDFKWTLKSAIGFALAWGGDFTVGATTLKSGDVLQVEKGEREVHFLAPQPTHLISIEIECV